MARRTKIRDRLGRLRNALPGEILKDGEAVVTTMALMDAARNRPNRVHTTDTAAHRPGPVSLSRFAMDTRTAAALDAKDEAYQALVKASSERWRVHDLNNEQAAALVGSLRRLAGAVETGQGITVPDPDDDDDDEDMQQDAAQIRDSAWAALVRRDENSWRGSR